MYGADEKSNSLVEGASCWSLLHALRAVQILFMEWVDVQFPFRMLLVP